MTRRWMIVIVAAYVAACLSGCAGGTSGGTSEGTTQAKAGRPISTPSPDSWTAEEAEERWEAMKAEADRKLAAADAAGDKVAGEAREGTAAPARQFASPTQQWVRASGNLWAGEKLYFGPDPATRWLVGEVLGGNDRHTDPVTGQTYRGLKIRYPDGHSEWKERNAVISGAWYIKRDDPALAAERWAVLQ